SSTYLRVPLTFYWRSKSDKSGHRYQLAAGAITGLLINGHTKHKSDADGTQKNSGGYNLAKFRYGGFLRAGYGGIGVFAKYYVNDMFEDSPAQKGLKNLSLGATIGF
ncbi:MAG: PorT family protein, partial [Sphingobacteriaceae bacterium]